MFQMVAKWRSFKEPCLKRGLYPHIVAAYMVKQMGSCEKFEVLKLNLAIGWDDHVG